MRSLLRPRPWARAQLANTLRRPFSADLTCISSPTCQAFNGLRPRVCDYYLSAITPFFVMLDNATRGLLVTDHVILNHGQVTWTTPELAPPLLTTTPHQREDVSALDRFNVHRCPTRRVFSGTGLELMTRQATIQYHSATAANCGGGDRWSRHLSLRSPTCLRLWKLSFLRIGKDTTTTTKKQQVGYRRQIS
ncbi:uncharacterized protein TNCV_578021 [Trichonephila clavipes]|nr:uncharacterized protein TNCV_578021 [Trichonephila clavipes]